MRGVFLVPLFAVLAIASARMEVPMELVEDRLMEERPWMRVTDDPASRAHALVARMNLTEKINMLYGVNGEYVGTIQGNTRLGIPAILMNDGPQGFRAPEKYAGTTTAWPCGLAVAATWDAQLAYAWGAGMGEEFTAKGANVQLGPGLNVARVPVNGRNFEYISGEDPALGAAMVAPAIKGIQSQGVIANAKHYVQNNQETNRGFVSENVDERTQWEIYYPPFKAAVDAGVLSVMCSYNKINEVWSCENHESLNVSLKTRMGFKGWVMSDWGGTHSTELAATAGLDQQMPDGSYFNEPLLKAVQSGAVAESIIDDKVVRILTSMFTAGLFDRPASGSLSANVTSPAHNTLARNIAAASAVLLRNTGVLPLSSSTPLRIAVVGDQATNPHIHGDGSGEVIPPYVVTPLSGITRRARGSTVKWYSSNDPNAVSAAAAADVAIVVTGTVSGEGSDRKTLALPSVDDGLIDRISAVQRKTIAVVLCPGAVLMPWANSTAAIIIQFMPGQEAGNALADVLFGDVNPSGRLPLTMPNRDNEVGFTQEQYPGVPKIRPADATYSEKLLIGYRWYDANNVVPNFPFGHGLGYTTFAYSALTITKGAAPTAATASFTLRNAGTRAGCEVPQLYVTYPAASGEPLRQLRAFSKVCLPAGQTTQVSLSISVDDISIWDVTTHGWLLQRGVFPIAIGASSRDLRLLGTFSI